MKKNDTLTNAPREVVFDNMVQKYKNNKRVKAKKVRMMDPKMADKKSYI